MASSESLPTVAEFYKGKNIFITGITGFVGKVLLEKLLRSCPDIKAIYGLVRPMKGKTAQQRVEGLLAEQCFDNLRREQPDFTSKIQVIAGDTMEEEFGISELDQQFLIENIHIVIHAAATVRFTEHLRLAVQINLLPVRVLVKFCKQFKQLEAFVHVSTAYANCDVMHIEERTYDPYVHPQKVIDMIEWLDDKSIEMITPTLLRNLPNTYTFTKKLAEKLLVQEGAGLPIVIVRPSIVTASWKEPFAGWIDNFNGASGLYIAYGKGLLQSFKADPTTVADIIPVDFTVNVIIASAWYKAVVQAQSESFKTPMIYNVTSGGLNPCTWGEMEEVVANYFKEFPPTEAWRRPGKKAITTNSFMHNYWLLVSHLLPAFLADSILWMSGRKPRMVNIYNKLHTAMDSLNFFVEQTWDWTHQNIDELHNKMSQEDQSTYFFNPRDIDWTSYIESFCGGTKMYVLKEDPNSLPAARAHIRKLRNIRYVFNTLVLIVCWRILVSRSSLARNSWYFMMGLVYKFVQLFRLSSSVKH